MNFPLSILSVQRLHFQDVITKRKTNEKRYKRWKGCKMDRLDEMDENWLDDSGINGMGFYLKIPAIFVAYFVDTLANSIL